MPAPHRIAAHPGSRHAATRRKIISADITAERRGQARRSAPAAGQGADAGAPGARLGKYANTAATAGHGHDREPGAARVGQAATASRGDRYLARRWLSEVTGLRRVSHCGRVSVAESGEVGLQLAESSDGTRTAGFGGLATCGSVWACPVCSAKVSARRTQEVESALAWNAARGGSVALLTLTMRHHTGHRLRALRRALSGAWRHITAHRSWKADRKALGMDGYIRAIECTIGESGWHLHAHVLLMFDGPVSAELVTEWTDDLYELWAEGLARHGMESSRAHGIDVRIGQGALDGLGKYLSKLTFETAGGRFKKGRTGGRTPFELLDDAINVGLADDFDRWFEWEHGSKGMRQMVWSRGLKAQVGVAEASDEDIAEEELDGHTVARITPAGWRQLYPIAAELLTVLEQGGVHIALSWLDYRQITYELGPRYEPPTEGGKAGAEST